MRVTIFGSGYVGLVTGACLAEAGNHVVCVDVDAGKVARLNRGEVPIHEPGLEALIKRNREAGRLEFTTDAGAGVDHGLFQFIAVGTPPDEDGSADLQHVLTRGPHHRRAHRPTTRSSSPSRRCRWAPPTRCGRKSPRRWPSAAPKVEFDVVSNPEFLKEGAAIAGLHEARPGRRRHRQPAHHRAAARALRAVHAATTTRSSSWTCARRS